MTYTNFNGYSHGTLRDMVQAMNSGEVMAASDPWRRAADTLKAIHASLGSASGEAAVDWEGSTSDAFYSKMTKLANNINNTASYAQDAAETLKHMAAAIDLAKQTMPEEPGLWDKVTDAVGDTASAAVGNNDEDTKTAVTDEKKAQAVTVLQTLAMKYRVATPVLKPPSMGQRHEQEVPPPSDPTGVAAISALISGAGLGVIGGNGQVGGGAVGASTSSRISGTTASSQQTPRQSSTAAAPTDSAIKGGTAQQASKAPGPVNYGPGTGIDGGVQAPSSTSTGGHTAVGSSSTSTSANGGQNSVGYGGGVGPGGIGVNGAAGKDVGRSGFGGSATRGGSAFGAGGMGEGGLGGGGRGGVGGRAGAGSARQAGGVVGEAGGRGGSGSKAFTEGGSGLGARGRAQSEQAKGVQQGKGAQGQGAQGPGQGKGTQGQGMPTGDGRRKKDKEKGGRRPDYLVEDEETWVSGQPSNPNVVE